MILWRVLEGLYEMTNASILASGNKEKCMGLVFIPGMMAAGTKESSNEISDMGMV